SFRHEGKNLFSLTSNIVRDIYVDTTNADVWVATSSGLTLLNRLTGEIKIFKHSSSDEHTIISDDLTSVCKDKYGKIWVGTRRNGLNVYYPDREKFFLYSNETGSQNALSSNRINTISQGRSGMFWAATEDGGLNAFNPKSLMFKFSNQVIKGSTVIDGITSVNEMRDGTVWFGTRGNGIFSLYADGTTEFVNVSTGKTIIHVMENVGNELIIVTEDG